MAKNRESHLSQTLSSMLAAQFKLQGLYNLSHRLEADAVAGRHVDRRLVRQVGSAVETQREELAMSAHCLSTMYPAANEPAFEVAL